MGGVFNNSRITGTVQYRSNVDNDDPYRIKIHRCMIHIVLFLIPLDATLSLVQRLTLCSSIHPFGLSSSIVRMESEAHYATSDPATLGCIFNCLSHPRDLASASCVCRLWRLECSFDGLWKSAYQRMYGAMPDPQERRER